MERTLTLMAAVAALTSAVSAPAPSAPGLDPAALSEAIGLTDGWLAAERTYLHVPSLSVGVVAGGRLAWSKGYGSVDQAGRIPASVDTIYPIGSVSKMFTAVAAMQLVEAGRLSLDAPITDVLPWAKVAAPAPGAAMPISLRALLSHSSGLPREAGTAAWTAPGFDFPTAADLRKAVVQARPYDPPLTRFEYSNLGVSLVGEAVEAASREAFADYVRGHVLASLALRDTRPDTPKSLLGLRTPAGFGARDRDGVRHPLPLVDVKAYAPAAGFSSTVRDLCAFVIWQMRLLSTGEGGVLKPDTLREMQRAQYADPAAASGVGLGFILSRRNGMVLVGHDGETPGYRSNVWINPAMQTAVVVLRSTSDGPGPYASGVLALLQRRLATPASIAPPPMDLTAFAGRYSEQPWGGEGLLAPWAGRLAYLSVPTNDPGAEIALFAPVGGDLFRRVRADGSLGEDMRFQRDKAGRVTGFVQNDNQHRRLP